jgi:lipopolysaccharide transport system ATP-binding protein
MSSDATPPALRVEGLGKQYRLGASAGGHATYRSIREEVLRPFRRGVRAPEQDRSFWALRNVSFEIQPGERVGIIGRNGAGKSTLLKLLARITAPTEGVAEVRGRVGSLLEVGTGFHPELSGRDNILLSGAILGMRRSEIKAKTDEIVEFAGVHAFLDTPVKRYSSGMYLRLAFAVAAHLEPEILLVDEVLAVGDAEFQKKCLGRMQEIGESGRTVLFVSHSMPSVLRLCERVILLDRGGVAADGDAQVVLRKYLDSGLGSAAERHWPSQAEAPGDDVARLKSVVVRDDRGTVAEELDIRRPVSVEVEYWHLSDDESLRPSVNLHVSNEDGVLLFVTNDFNDHSWKDRRRTPGVVRATCRIPGNFLAEGRFFVLAAVSTFTPVRIHAMEADAVSFHVVDRSTGDGVRGEFANEWPGVVRPMLEWAIEGPTGMPAPPAELPGR